LKRLDVLVATCNSGKAREFREMLGEDQLAWSDLSRHVGVQTVEETGKTFRANACIKAAWYASLFKRWTIGDDSGLEVDAIGGSPGVYSARWAQRHDAGQGDVANNQLLLKQLEAVADAERTARFVCVLALADPDGHVILTARDTVEGRILRRERGGNGFGYDPLFMIDALGKTTAELEPGVKHAISHRGKALRHLKSMMERIGIL